MRVSKDEPRAQSLVSAIHAGEVETVRQLLQAHPGLASTRLVDEKGGSGTPLHAVTDWPGFFPNGPEIVAVLIDAGADPNAPIEGSWHAETPLHWAASSDDVDVAEALVDGGANVEVPNGSIGKPLDNAVGYACWNVARLLVARGAAVTKLWHASALGMLDRTEELLATQPEVSADELSQALWHACAAGQRRTAELLLSRGADLNWIPDYAQGTPLDAANGLGTCQENVISWLREQGARSAGVPPRSDPPQLETNTP